METLHYKRMVSIYCCKNPYFVHKSIFIKHKVIPFGAITNGTMNIKYKAYKMKHSFWNMILKKIGGGGVRRMLAVILTE
jgi:hypothetical protein